MAELSFDATRLKTIRKARKIGRAKLARLVGMTERQVTRLETARAPLLDEALLTRMSDALHVPLPTLTGQFPLVAEDLEPVAAKTCTSGCCG